MFELTERTAVIPDFDPLYHAFGQRLTLNAPLNRYTAARVGGPAQALIEVTSDQELAAAVRLLWDQSFPFVILGGGSNVLISDAGMRGVVILNKSRRVRFNRAASQPVVWAESGANFGLIARQAAQHGWAGLEWAAGLPGTVGGAVVGNAGAHGGDMAGTLVMAEILHQDGKIENWPVERFHYTYRSSILKAQGGWPPGVQVGMVLSPTAVVLAAILRLEKSTPDLVLAKMDAFTAQRRRTQPPGASMGSMFKNPPGDYAGRLIEATGLKGARVGDAQISELHANFFINVGQARATDIFDLIQLAHSKVLEIFGVDLALEIELLGDWPAAA